MRLLAEPRSYTYRPIQEYPPCDETRSNSRLWPVNKSTALMNNPSGSLCKFIHKLHFLASISGNQRNKRDHRMWLMWRTVYNVPRRCFGLHNCSQQIGLQLRVTYPRESSSFISAFGFSLKPQVIMRYARRV